VLGEEGTAVKARIDDFEGMTVRELVQTGGEVAEAPDCLAGQTAYAVLRGAGWVMVVNRTVWGDGLCEQYASMA